MKKKSLFILLFVMCIGFIPKNTFALQVYNNVYIDYRFFVDEDESDAGNLKFKLYDKSGTLNFESKYDLSTKQYYFEYDENGFNKVEYYDNYYHEYGYYWKAYDYSIEEDNYRPYVPYLYEYGNFNLSYKNIITHQNDDWYWTWDAYTYIPLILEETTTHYKKIIFASITIRSEIFDYVHVILINNTTKFKEEPISLSESFLENVDFMRKTMLDYSDELWEELNNEPVASSEIYTNNKASTNYKYINQSTIDGTRNVPEETIDDYASSLPVLSFKKVDSTDEDKDNNTKNNIINVITNPKTWNNGIVILVISMIVIIGSSIVFIKRKSN